MCVVTAIMLMEIYLVTEYFFTINYASQRFAFIPYGFYPASFTQFRDPAVRPAPQGDSRFRGKEVWYFQTERGSNPETRASEEDALSTPPTPHGHEKVVIA